MPAKRPNIILFTTDQHRGDYIGLCPDSVTETPNLDSWINHGAYFPNAYSEIPSTTGARRILHSGKGNYTCGAVGYTSQEYHEPNVLAAVLANAGYHCINVGWRNMHPRRKLYGFHSVIPHDLVPECDDYLVWLRQQVGPEAVERGHGSDANGWLARPWHLEERLHPTVWTTDVSLDQLRKRDPTRPFFLWCSHLRPHSPYDPPQFYWDMYANRDLGQTPVGDWAAKHDIGQPGIERAAWRGRLTPLETQRCRAGYMGCISHIDYELGRMMEYLNRDVGAQDAAETLWLFTSDHGDMMGDHHLHRKTYAYEGSARIPFVVRYPQSVNLPKGTFHQTVGLQDVMPTILDVCGVAAPSGMTGSSVTHATRGESWREFLHGEHSPCYSADEAMHFLTDGVEKYIWFPMSGNEQLFSLRENRLELKDLSTDPAWSERLSMWRQRLVELLGERGDNFSDGRRLIVQDEPWGADSQNFDHTYGLDV